jgi:hypothetical protein
MYSGEEGADGSISQRSSPLGGSPGVRAPRLFSNTGDKALGPGVALNRYCTDGVSPGRT